jgi:hypothetical protein
MVDQIQPESVEYFKYVCSMITKNAIFTREFEYKIVAAKAAFNKKIVFTSNWGVN